MGDQRLEDERIDEMGQTVFGGHTTQGAWYQTTGRLGRWWARFAGTKAQPYIAQQNAEGPTPMHPLAGDTLSRPDGEVILGDGSFGRNNGAKIPEYELNRKKRYTSFESMDDYPEISSAFDIYADDATQKDLRGKPWVIQSDSQVVIDEIERLFEITKMEKYYWDIIRNCVKYGDCFVELVVDVENPKLGIQRIKILNPSYILRVENEYGYLTDFLQEIPDKNDWNTFGWQSETMKNTKYIVLDKNQLTHFRLFTSDPSFYPYGRSIAALAVRIYRSLRLMEDAMLIYRLSRAPERRVFYIDTSNLPSHKAEMFVERLKQKFKKEKFYNPVAGDIDERYNPLSMDEDFFVPYKGNRETKIDVLPGAQNLGEVDDVKYFRDKLLAALKIPKDFIVEFDKSPERKANLAQLDVKFAKVISRVQRDMETGFEAIARRQLRIKGFPATEINNLRIRLPDPSDMFTKRKLDVDDQKTRVVQAVKGLDLFTNEWIYKEYYNMSDMEIEQMVKDMETQREEQMEQDPMGMGMDPMMGGGGMPMEGEEDPEQELEGDENIPPTDIAASTSYGLYQDLIVENGADHWRTKAFKRVLDKQFGEIKSA